MTSTEPAADTPFEHVPVLRAEVVAGLAVQPGARLLDATVGGGGHARALLASAPETHLVGLDRDERALTAAAANLADFGDRVTLVRANFAEFQPEGTFNGILADLGVSSPQLDAPERGFSFQHAASLDMRMDRRQALTAADIVNHWRETDLADAIYHLGEERLSRRIARAIVQQRPFAHTTDLAAAIARCVPRQYRHGRIHPATRTFQALRIAVNDELVALDTLLERAPAWLAPGGRLGIISFHSLEDRRVKQAFRDREVFEVLTKKPVMAGPEEQKLNPRARSAKLRVAARSDVLSSNLL